MVCADSYFSFRLSVARRRDANSCSPGQNWFRPAEISQNLHLLRRTVLVQVFFSAGGECLALVPSPAAGLKECGRLFTTEQPFVVNILMMKL